jgi:GNAT superfamily N-acetyltransferase
LTIRIRQGTKADFERLRAIAVEAKAHWGYDRALVEEWAQGGDFEPESLRARLLYVAEVEGAPVGWAALIPRGEVGWLEDLWIDPAWIGQGLGRALFEHVAAEARARGARRLEWEAEPNAQQFYEHLGAAYIRDSEETEWGRVLQVLAVEL